MADPIYDQMYQEMLNQRMRGLGQQFSGNQSRLMETLGGTGMYGGGYMGQALQNLMVGQSQAQAGAAGEVDIAHLQSLAQMREQEKQRQWEEMMQQKQYEQSQPKWTSAFGSLIGAVGSALPFFLTGGASSAIPKLANLGYKAFQQGRNTLPAWAIPDSLSYTGR